MAGTVKKVLQFSEFDAIIASPENIYLIESKWDNLIGFKEEELTLRKEQIIHHQIFSWYLTHWGTKYVNKWTDFEIEHRPSFNFKGKKIAPPNSVLAANLEFILSRHACKINERLRNLGLEPKEILVRFRSDS